MLHRGMAGEETCGPRQWVSRCQMKEATYHLGKHIASFEFFSWQAMVQANGAQRIVFDISNPKTSKFDRANVMNRFRSIIEPGPALAGLPVRYGTPEDGGLDAVASQFLLWIKSGGRFTRLKTVKPAVPCGFTVTLRNNKDGARGRDSRQEDWRTFAQEIGAIVIEDWFDKPIHLHDRMALYAGAKMNFGVCNGPMHMLTLTEYPVMMFVNTQSARNSQLRWGQEEGQNCPWMLPNQKLVWMKDHIENLRRAFDGRSSAPSHSADVPKK